MGDESIKWRCWLRNFRKLAWLFQGNPKQLTLEGEVLSKSSNWEKVMFQALIRQKVAIIKTRTRTQMILRSFSVQCTCQGNVWMFWKTSTNTCLYQMADYCSEGSNQGKELWGSSQTKRKVLVITIYFSFSIVCSHIKFIHLSSAEHQLFHWSNSLWINSYTVQACSMLAAFVCRYSLSPMEQLHS